MKGPRIDDRAQAASTVAPRSNGVSAISSVSLRPIQPLAPGKGKLQRLVETAERCGLVRALRPVHDRGRTSLTVLAYHRVVPTAAPESYPFDLELISATPAEFEWQMDYIRQNMNPVSLRQVIAHLNGGPALPPRAVAVTFDDGFDDTYHQAFPIMRRYGVCAAVFVTTGNLDSREPFWFELTAYLMMHVPPGAIRIAEHPHLLPYGPAPRERRRSLQHLLAVLKNLPESRRSALIREWTGRFAGEIDPATARLSRPLAWSEVREMAAAGIEFGSHTVTHPNLARLSEADVTWELAESKRVLEENLKHEVSTLAYPIGTRRAYDDRVVQCARRCGYHLAVSYVSGVNWLDSVNRFELRRHGIGMRTTRSYFRALTTLPGWIA